MTCNNQCCHDVQADQSICEFVLGPNFGLGCPPIEDDPGCYEQTIDNESCYTWLFDDADNFGQITCFGCDIGCKPCVDSPYSMINFWSIDEDGYGYLRPKLDAQRYRNARNQIADFPVKRVDTKPELFIRNINLQRSRCKRNEIDVACWGDQVGHPCQCYHEPSSEDEDGDGFADFRCEQWGIFNNAPVPGFMRDKFFYHYLGWPMRDGTGITCSKWDHGTSAAGINPEYDLYIQDTKRGNAQAMWGYTLTQGVDAPCNIDVMAGCGAEIPAGTDCQTTEGDCGSEIRDGDGPIRTHYPQSILDRSQFEYMRFDNFNPGFAGGTAESEFRNRVLREVVNIQDDLGPFDAVQHGVGPGSNVNLGEYHRTWQSTVEAGHLVETVQAHTKWGNCPVTADVVITKVDFYAHVQILRSKTESQGPNVNRDRRITPLVVCHLIVELGVRATLDDDCTVGGEPILLTNVNSFPEVSPPGNEIIYPIRISPVIDWHGRLGFHSHPQTQRLTIENDPNTPDGDASCRDMRFSVGTLTVPGLPSDIDDEANPNRHYAGGISFDFTSSID